MSHISDVRTSLHPYLDSCRFETKMRQNAPNLISISIFFQGNTPEPPPLRLPPNPRGGEGKEGSERAGEGKGKFASLLLGG